MISMESFPPLMFAGLIFIMLIGFPVAFSLAALGLLAFASRRRRTAAHPVAA